MGAVAEECSRAKESLTICMQFVTDLTFHSVPEVLSQTISSSAGFNLLARIFARTAARIYSQVRAMCCPDAAEPTPLFQRLETVTRLIGGSSYTARATVEKTEKGIVFRVTGVETIKGKLINTAPIIGVLAGMVEAVGAKATPLHGPEALRHAPRDTWRLYPEQVGEDSVVIVVVPPGA